jgi:hypothetical protein
VNTLQSHPRWRVRDNAAHALRKYDWRCHPEILSALAAAMLTDCEEEVREESAESLTKISPAPCSVETHAALWQAAEGDPDHATRKWARRGLERVSKSCAGPCDACEFAETSFADSPRFPLIGRFFTPRNSGYLTNGSKIFMPRSEGFAGDVGISSPSETQVYEMPAASPVETQGWGDPLDNLPQMEQLPPSNLPTPLNVEPRIPPPPAADSSPFLAPPRAERLRDGKFAAKEGSVESKKEASVPSRIAERRGAKRPEPEPEPVRRRLSFGLLGRRGR